MKSNVPEYSGNRYEKLIEINLKSIFSFNFFVINYHTGSEANPDLKHPDYFAGSEPNFSNYIFFCTVLAPALVFEQFGKLFSYSFFVGDVLVH